MPRRHAAPRRAHEICLMLLRRLFTLRRDLRLERFLDARAAAPLCCYALRARYDVCRHAVTLHAADMMITPRCLMPLRAR